MINRFSIIINLILFNLLLTTELHSVESFNFNVTEIEILENGNRIIGNKRGVAETNDGISILADKFDYNKITNILRATDNVVIEDKIDNYKLYSNFVEYLKTEEVFVSKGKTNIELYNKFIIDGSEIKFDKINNQIESKYKVSIKDIEINEEYKLDNFIFLISDEILKGDNIEVRSNFDKPNGDQYFFKSAILDLKKKKFLAKDTKILVKKDIFKNSENDPRLLGISSISENNKTTINKGIFTSCKQTDKCPPWVIESEKIVHDKTKKQINYKNAILKVYNIPVFYYPIFFHPDPTVERQSGFLKPQLSNSKNLGNGLNLPYYKVLAENKDLTISPTLFDEDIKMIQNEYRQVNKNSDLFLDFALNQGYKSTNSDKKNSMSHIFIDYKKDFEFENFQLSKLTFNLERVSNDTYLKIFDNNLTKNITTPNDYNNLKSNLEIKLDTDNSNFTTGISSYENLSLNNSDRYQYNLPYYNYNTTLPLGLNSGSVNFSSSGNNSLTNTNKLNSTIVNNLNFQSDQFFTNSGLINNWNLYFKNFNAVGKKSETYENTLGSELATIFEINSKLPLIKNINDKINYLTPKISFRINPADMDNNSNGESFINVNNVFSVNRHSNDRSFEQGRSITLGLDYRREDIEEINKYFDLKLATVVRDKYEDRIPKSSTLNNKTSNIFGSISTNKVDFVNLSYDFSLNNSLDEVQYNAINADFVYGRLNSKFTYIEENDVIGSAHSIMNSTSFNFGNGNNFRFNTRRNEEINLTEYYDLIYEYQNDCLTAGLKYNKTFYEDRDVKPSENLLFTITLIPLTTYEQEINENLYN